MKLDLNKEEGKLLELAQGNKEICELIKHAFVKLREGREKIVNSDIGKIENKGAISIAKELARVAYLSKPENIYFVVRYGILSLKDGDVDGAEEVVQTYKSKHGDSNNQRFKFLEASIHKNKERHDQAIAILQNLPKNQYVIDELAECYYLSRNYADAKSLLENNQLSPKSALILAKIYKQEGFSQKAYKVLEPFRGKYQDVDTFIDGLGPIDIASKSEAETSLWIEKGIQKFKKEHNPSKTVFVMMKFSGGNPSKDKKLETLFNTIKLELDKYGLDTVRADEKNYSESDYIWDNVQIYMNGCNYGVPVLENLYSEEMNPNVALEYGYMLAKGKRVLLLKEKSFGNIRADILGKIWKEFEFDDHESIKKAIQNWMVDLGITRIKA